MARIDAGAVATESRWAHPVGDRRGRARPGRARAARSTTSTVDVDPDVPVRLDPRLTATALAHLLENAAQYAPPGSPIEVTRAVDGRRADDRGARSRSGHRAGRPAAPVRAVLSRRRGEGRAPRAPAWACGSPAGCWRSSAAASGRRTAPTAAPSSRSSCPLRPRQPEPMALADRMTPRARILLVDDEVAIQRAVAPLLRVARLRRRDRRHRRRGARSSSPSSRPI